MTGRKFETEDEVFNEDDDFGLQETLSDYLERRPEIIENVEEADFDSISDTIITALRSLVSAQHDVEFFSGAASKAKSEYDEVLNRVGGIDLLRFDLAQDENKSSFIRDLLEEVIRNHQYDYVGSAARNLIGAMASKETIRSDRGYHEPKPKKPPVLRAMPSDRIIDTPISINIKDLVPSRDALVRLKELVDSAGPKCSENKANTVSIDLSESDHTLLLRTIETAIALHFCKEFDNEKLDLLVSSRNVVAKTGALFGTAATATGAAGTFFFLLNQAILEMDKVIDSFAKIAN